MVRAYNRKKKTESVDVNVFEILNEARIVHWFYDGFNFFPRKHIFNNENHLLKISSVQANYTYMCVCSNLLDFRILSGPYSPVFGDNLYNLIQT